MTIRTLCRDILNAGKDGIYFLKGSIQERKLRKMVKAGYLQKKVTTWDGLRIRPRPKSELISLTRFFKVWYYPTNKLFAHPNLRGGK
jgi:hypothetical protein